MEMSDGAIDRLVELQPAIADRLTALHQAYRGAVNRLQFVDDVISSEIGMDGRLPWEEVRDWFHLAGNYVDAIDRAAERMAEELWRQDEIGARSEEHTSELQSLMRISYAVFCLKKKKTKTVKSAHT